MLKEMVINNLALIGDAQLDFGDGLNVLTGETGAGKSIIVDAIMLLLGGKYDKSMLRFGEKTGFVEGVFDVTETAAGILAEMGYEPEDEVIVTRKFFESGKNEIRICGRPATASMLRRLTEKLVDIYGQHEYISLAKVSEQSRLFDNYIKANIASELEALSSRVSDYAAAVAKLSSIGTSDDRERLMDILQYQIDEIEKANVVRGEEDELSAKRKVLASAEKINSSLSSAYSALTGDEVNALALVDNALSSLSAISHLDEAYSSLSGRLRAASEEMTDIAECVRDELDKEFDIGDLDRIEDRLDVIKNIRKKYGDYDKMTEFLGKASEQLYELRNADKIFAKLNAEKDKLLDEIYEISRKLSDKRRSCAKVFEKEIEKHLNELGMNAVKFEIKFDEFPLREECEKFVSPKGMDKLEFYFSPNKGQPLQPMMKIISGGEMSRFMLALKVASGEKDDMPTMIFDEIDSGISGVTGQAVSLKLEQIALGHQVLCVTHLPQIAAMASRQFFIEKAVDGDNTFTHVTKLDRDGMIKEIARLSGVSLSEQASSAAADLKAWCDNYKQSLVSGSK